jgi:hypothetical protein
MVDLSRDQVLWDGPPVVLPHPTDLGIDLGSCEQLCHTTR